MKKLGVIGMGTITLNYYKGLKSSKKLKLVACCDTNKDFISKELFSDYNFYTDYKQMILKEMLDCVIISTPPATHYQIASHCIELGVGVIIEKPCVLEMGLLNQLITMAEDKGVDFQVMYHWQNGTEVEAFLDNYDTNKIESVRVSILDPYSEDGLTINADKLGLEGAWIDSGVNALSFVKLFLGFDTVKIKNVKTVNCKKSNLPVIANASFEIDGVNVEIYVDWTKGKNQKQSMVVYDGREILISHSKQTIFDGENVIKCDDMDRLTRHYYNYFTKNLSFNLDLKDTIKIHQVLLEVKKHYEAFIT